jgi:hypothetical protein
MRALNEPVETLYPNVYLVAQPVGDGERFSHALNGQFLQLAPISPQKSFPHAYRLLSHRLMNGQLECHGSQEERECQDRRPDPNNMEPLRAID